MRPGTSGACAACGSGALRPHLRVAGGAGPAGLVPTTDRFGVALADLVRCSTCGHAQLESFPPEAMLETGYAEAASDDYVEEEEGQRATARRLLDLVEAHTDHRGALLDLGCWVGFLMAEARGRGWTPTGVEPSRFASTWAREKLELDVRTADLLDAPLPRDHFDAVVLGDVIEHLPDPGAALDRIAGVLAPGGVLLLTLPDAGSRLARVMGARWWSVLPTHVQYFTRASLRTLLDRHGYTTLVQVTAPKAFTVRYYLSRIAGYSHGVARGLVRGAEALRLAERPWAPDFRDRMAVVARRRTQPTHPRDRVTTSASRPA